MSYVINKTTGEVLITILDGTADGPQINPGQNVSDVNLFGKNYPLFGDKLDENFITLLQNSAKSTPPTKPLQGELWYDISVSGSPVLKIYNGSAFVPVNPTIVSSAAPTTSSFPGDILTGSQWWDTVNYQLNTWNGSSWTVVGPNYKHPDGVSGPQVLDILDTVGSAHTVTAFYSQNNIIAISSYDQPFTLSPLNPIAGFNVISPGFTLATGVANLLYYGTATNSQNLGNIAAVNYARTDIIPTFTNNVYIAGGSISIDSAPTGAARYYNSVNGGNISLWPTINGVSIRALSIWGADGSTNVLGNLNVASGGSLSIFGVTSTSATGTGQLVFSANPTITGTLNAQNVAFNGTLTATGNLAINGNLFTVNATTGDTGIAGNLTIGRFSNVTVYGVTSTGATGTGGIVFNNSPVLSGVPTAPTPAQGDVSSNIATTSFANTAIATSQYAPWQGSHKIVSTSSPDPSQGNVGDFWFQI
jgi:hypothetical protein